MPKLTKKFIDALQFSDSGRPIYWDDSLPGFGIRIQGQSKVYLVQSRVAGRSKRVVIGKHGPFTLEQARTAAKDLLRDMAQGINPLDEKERQKALGVTLQEALEDYLKARQLKPVTRKDVIYTMNNHLKKWLALPLVSITPDMVVRLHRQLGATSPARANLAMRYLRSVLNFAAANYSAQDGSPLLAHNPVERLSAARLWYRVPRKTRFLQDHQIKPWMEAVLSLPEVPDREPGTGKHFPRLSHGDLARDFFLILL
ncbi:MAG: Arm DNA-binding domain-containing protein, partial [Desulfatibacillaceae bacterium]|nr:Arm DNA-binding domain-containing protein [Desulfatibacillaceae bacterium]